MVKVIIISVDGNKKQVSKNKNEIAIMLKPLRISESVDTDEGLLFIYSGSSEEFNKYDFQYQTIMGDAILVLRNEKGEFIDLTIEKFRKIYECSIDLDDDLLEDELEEEDDDYEYDSFCVEDDDEVI